MENGGNGADPARLNKPGNFFNRLKLKIAQLFEPEEVEVTFKQEGKTTRYTYTKVTHKQIA